MPRPPGPIENKYDEIESVPRLHELVFGDGTPKKALKTALIVGTVLIAINQGDIIFRGESVIWWKILMTYCVP